jgi:hypothetical protein
LNQTINQELTEGQHTSDVDKEVDSILAIRNNEEETSQDQTRQGTRQPPAMNTTNLRTSVVFGHDMKLPKPENTTQLVSMNVNGIQRGDDYQDITEMAHALKTSSVDLAALGETNINWESAAWGKLYEKFQRVYHHVRLSTSSSAIKYNTIYQPGGTATIVTDNYTGRVTGNGSNLAMG